MTRARHRVIAPEDVPRVWRRALLFAFAALALVAGIVAFLMAGGSSLDGTAWTLTGWSADSIGPQTFGITAELRDGRISGKAPVNSYSGEYAAGGIKFTTGEITQTLMAGPEPAMEAESIYFDLLAQVETYTLEGDVLTLRGSGGSSLLVFERTSP